MNNIDFVPYFKPGTEDEKLQEEISKQPLLMLLSMCIDVPGSPYNAFGFIRLGTLQNGRTYHLLGYGETITVKAESIAIANINNIAQSKNMQSIQTHDPSIMTAVLLTTERQNKKFALNNLKHGQFICEPGCFKTAIQIEISLNNFKVFNNRKNFRTFELNRDYPFTFRYLPDKYYSVLGLNKEENQYAKYYQNRPIKGKIIKISNIESEDGKKIKNAKNANIIMPGEKATVEVLLSLPVWIEEEMDCFIIDVDEKNKVIPIAQGIVTKKVHSFF